jgi:putative aldouronate transport system permease protein
MRGKQLKTRDWDEIRFQIVAIFFITIYIILSIMPFINILAKSLSDEASVLAGQVVFWPINFNLRAYSVVFNNKEFINALGVSVFVTVVGTTLNIVATVLTAYPLSRSYLKGRRVIRFLYIFTMLFSGGLIPTYLVVRSVGLIDNLFSLILPNLVGVFQMILVANYFLTIPDDIEDSAKIDGASNVTILFRIMIPLSMAVIATITLFYAVGHWNEFFSALMYINKRNLRPLQLYLRELIQMASNTFMNLELMDEIPMESVQGATLVAATLPILLVYPFLQRYFVKGVMVGAVKQ